MEFTELGHRGRPVLSSPQQSLCCSVVEMKTDVQILVSDPVI